MARRLNNEILYKIIKDFLNLCLLQDRSLLWPDIACNECGLQIYTLFRSERTFVTGCPGN